MPVGLSRTIIVDDSEPEGMQIAKSLWDSGMAVRFVHYNPSKFIKEGPQKLRGVRLIFMDIDLLGTGTMGSDGTQSFTAIQQVLTHLLSEENGPYILTTWSAHDDYAERLFSHLSERLPIALRPVTVKRLNKEDFKGSASTVGKKLLKEVKKTISDLGPTACLTHWENLLTSASCDTVHSLMQISETLPDRDKADGLKSVLKGLAKAEADKQLTKDNALASLHIILNQMLFDHVSRKSDKDVDNVGQLIISGGKEPKNEDWKSMINGLINLDHSNGQDIHAPGAVFEYPESQKFIRIPKIQPQSFLAENFFVQKELGKLDENARISIVSGAKLVLVEITPPCDYAQAKFVWHRYVIAALIPSTTQKKYIANGNYLKQTTTFKTPTIAPFTLVLNSKLTISVKPEERKRLKSRLFKIRKILLADIMTWLSFQTSRSGYTSLS